MVVSSGCEGLNRLQIASMGSCGHFEGSWGGIHLYPTKFEAFHFCPGHRISPNLVKFDPKSGIFHVENERSKNFKVLIYQQGGCGWVYRTAGHTFDI